MAEIQEVRVPDVGDVEGVTVAEVLVAPGDPVSVDDSLISLESDKASMDVPSPLAGRVRSVAVAVGDEVQEGAVILTLELAGEASEAAAEPAEPEPAAEPAPAAAPTPAAVPAPAAPPATPAPAAAPAPAPPRPAAPPASGAQPINEVSFAKAYASPAVRRFARELGVDLGRVEGTGRKSRITKDDVRKYVKTALAQPAKSGGGGFELPPMPEIDFSKFGEIEIQPLNRIRKLTARNMHRSWLHVPHVTQHGDADITELEAFRKSQADEAAAQGFKLTPVAFLLKAAAAALQKFPDFNSSLDPSGESLILKRYVNIGVAVDTPKGLVVPVLRDVDQKGIYELAGELLEISGKARDGKLLPRDFQGGCFTISSLGGIGGTAFTPIVNAPEVAILGASRHAWKPVWQGGEFVPRLMLPLSLSYDHRVIDGAAAARFIVYLGAVLSDIRRLLL